MAVAIFLQVRQNKKMILNKRDNKVINHSIKIETIFKKIIKAIIKDHIINKKVRKVNKRKKDKVKTEVHR